MKFASCGLLVSLAIAAVSASGSQDSAEEIHSVAGPSEVPPPLPLASAEGTSTGMPAHSIRLFGQQVAPGVRLDNPNFGGVQLPPRDFDYPAETSAPQPIHRTIADRIASDIAGGRTTPLYDGFYNRRSMNELVRWSREQFLDPRAHFHIHVVSDERGAHGAHLIKRIPFDVFHSRLFPHAKLNRHIWHPYAVYTAPLKQIDFVRTGRFQMARVELVYDRVPGWEPSARTPKWQLLHALEFIEHG